MSYSAYFLNFAQFCLRIVPFTLLLFLPHGSDGWKGRAVHPLLVVVGLGAFDIAAAALSPLFAAKLAQNLYHLSAFALVTLLYMLLIRDSLTKKTVGLFLAAAFWGAQTQLLLTMNLARYLAEGGAVDAIALDNDAIGSLSSLGLLILADALLLPPAAAFEVRIARPYLQYVKPENMRIEMLLLQFLGIFLSLFSFFFVGVISSVGGGLQYVALETLIFIAIHCALCWFVFRTSLSAAQNAENALQVELLRENSKSLQREMERSREMYHDLRQLLRQLYAISEQYGIAEELRPYIEKITALTERTNLFFCENKCLNALFQYYVGYANKKEIPVSVSAVVGEVSINDADLTIVAANALENAINGAEEYRQRTGMNPEISVIVGAVKNYLAIQVTNSCASANYAPDAPAGASPLSADAFVSARKGGGHGLKRIQFLAEKYHGYANFQFDEQKLLWTTRISLAIRKGKGKA